MKYGIALLTGAHSGVAVTDENLNELATFSKQEAAEILLASRTPSVEGLVEALEKTEAHLAEYIAQIGYMLPAARSQQLLDTVRAALASYRKTATLKA